MKSSSLVISGSELVCTSNKTFTLNNLPSGLYVNWSHSSLLTPVSSTNDTFTVRAKNSSVSGQGWVKATITTAGGETIEKQLDVWVGKPAFGFDGISGPMEVSIDLNGNYTAQYSVLSSAINAQGVTWYDWSTSSNIMMQSSHLYQYDVYVSGTTEGRGYIYFHATNTCGTSISEKMVRVVSSGDGPIVFSNITVYPNPAS